MTEESNVLWIMNKYVETAKESMRLDGAICSVLFFFYKEDGYKPEQDDFFGIKIEPMGFYVKDDLSIKKEMQRVANREVKKNKGLIALGMIQDIFYTSRTKIVRENSLKRISEDPESLSAIYSCVFFPGKPLVQKTTFYKDFGDKETIFTEDNEELELHNISFVDQPWNSLQNPTAALLIDPFLTSTLH